MSNTKIQKLQKRKAHIKKQLAKISDRPRLIVYRSNNHIYAQIFDVNNNRVVVGSSDIKVTKGKPVDRAIAVGKDIGAKATKQGISKVVFDRNGYKYHGRVKALADAARESGLEF
jgi:large subunit ribosomal protein L18